ncbi:MULTISPECIES: hypothetical protein [Bradyrhizobium]|uniref:Uncharacterized protein n=3 Tax=Bradyrhizobium TaxID=374 RepID=A0AAE5X8F6_9BRAD|nr:MULTISPECIES: hypothetical protein [Bradyrhizobium]MCG2632868.1 hypothetical protein [Bradyrhizobium zhengyangense]MCG2645481.1 hypothetical protein [Bradyrhizobium zhengyangense]MCG2673040.1 hypothetical protein [Bradyrhizobium zhengyangense]MDN4984433.1 hypothetical protein [Bradyrhizobium sp. WYCCWR 13022]MDN5002426.1 hypothetical protein [Bradyrhizobium sp. WYCCWR 12677]
MDVASYRLNPSQASKLRLVKDMRERSALRQLSNTQAERQIAVKAMEKASKNAASAEKRRASLEAELYLELASSNRMCVTELDRRLHLVIGRLTAEIATARQVLEQARIAQQQAQAAVVEARVVWAKRSAASQKWQQIECDVQRSTNACSECAAQIETDDEVLLRYQSGSRSQAIGVLI